MNRLLKKLKGALVSEPPTNNVNCNAPSEHKDGKKLKKIRSPNDDVERRRYARSKEQAVKRRATRRASVPVDIHLSNRNEEKKVARPVRPQSAVVHGSRKHLQGDRPVSILVHRDIGESIANYPMSTADDSSTPAGPQPEKQLQKLPDLSNLAMLSARILTDVQKTGQTGSTMTDSRFSATKSGSKTSPARISSSTGKRKGEDEQDQRRLLDNKDNIEARRNNLPPSGENSALEDKRSHSPASISVHQGLGTYDSHKAIGAGSRKMSNSSRCEDMPGVPGSVA